MSLPFAPPLEPMLSKAADALPRGDGWLFEPKWDGFRTLVFRDGDWRVRRAGSWPTSYATRSTPAG